MRCGIQWQTHYHHKASLKDSLRLNLFDIMQIASSPNPFGGYYGESITPFPHAMLPWYGKVMQGIMLPIGPKAAGRPMMDNST